MARSVIATDAAPQAIGPYSQAIRLDNLVFCSGQIPIDPAAGKIVATDVEGQTTQVLANIRALLEAQGLTLDALQALLQMIEEKQRLLRLLNEYIDGPGLTVVIGAEHPDPDLRSFSLIASTYDDGTGMGTVGVIGPTRMRYSRAIDVVDGAAQAVARVLRDPN